VIPNNIQQIQQEIRELTRNNNWQAIIQRLQGICRPGQPGWQVSELLSSLGFAYTQVKKIARAIAIYKRWTELDPDQARPFYSLGYAYYLKQDWREAIYRFTQALERYPDYLICLYRLAYAYYAFNKPTKSLPVVERALEIYEDNADEDWLRRNRKTYARSLFLQGKVLYRLRKYPGALETFQKLLTIDKKQYIETEFKMYEIGKVFLAMKKYSRAIQYLEKALHRKFPQPYVLDRLGRTYHEMGEYSTALEYYHRGLQIRRLPFILINRAQTYRQMGQIAAAVKDLYEALRRDTKGKHKIYLELGNISMERKQLQEAFHYYRKAIKFKYKVYESDYAEAHYALVFYYLTIGKPDIARKEFQQALEINPRLEWDKTLGERLNLKEMPTVNFPYQEDSPEEDEEVPF